MLISNAKEEKEREKLKAMAKCVCPVSGNK